MPRMPTLRVTTITVLLLLAPVLLGGLAVPAAAVGGPTGARFTTRGVPGDATQATSVVFGFDPDTSEDQVNALGYNVVSWTPNASLVPAAGLDAMLTGVDACPSERDALDAAPSCVPLSPAASCPLPDDGGLGVPGKPEYCAVADAATVNVTLGLGRLYVGGVALRLLVAQQPEVGDVRDNVLLLGNTQWGPEDPSPAVKLAFTTTPPAGIAVGSAAACADPAAPEAPAALAAGETRVYYAHALDAEGACIGTTLAHWSVEDDRGALEGANPASSITFRAGPAGRTAVLGDDGAGHAASSAPIAVTPGALASVRIVDAEGAEVDDRTLSADDVLPLAVEGYDAGGNRVPALVTWTVSPATCGSLAPPSGVATVFGATDASAEGCRVVATSAAGAGSTGVLDVVPGQAVALSIRLGSTAGREILTTDVLFSDELYTLVATLADADGNRFEAPADTSWSMLGGCAALSAATGSRVTLQPLAPGADCRVRASAIEDLPEIAIPGAAPVPGVATLAAHTPALSVSLAADLAYIRLRTQPGGAGVSVAELDVTADDDATFCAAGYDADFRYLGDVLDAAWTLAPAANGTLTPVAGATCATFTPGKTGDVVVSAAKGAVERQATLHVAPGAPVSLRVVLASDRALDADLSPIPGGAERALAAAAHDKRGNDAGDLAGAAWRVDGGCASLSAATGGTSTIAVAYAPSEGCVLNVTAPGLASVVVPIGVVAPPVSRIAVVDASGAEVGARALTTDDTLALYAAGYDAAGHFVGLQTVTWSMAGEGNAFVGENPAPSVTFDPRVVGTETVTARLDETRSDATGALAIAHGVLASIHVERSLDGLGGPVGAQSLAADGRLRVYAIGRDADGAYVGPLGVSWSMQGCLHPLLGRAAGCYGTLDASDGHTTQFTGRSPGATTVLATLGDRVGATGEISVTHRTLVRVQLEVSPDGTRGVGVDTAAMTADDVLTLCARGYAAGDDDQGYVAAAWSVTTGATEGSGTFSAENARCTTFNATRAGAAVVTATVTEGAATFTDTLSVTIVAGRVVALHFRGMPEGVVAGAAQTLFVNGVDSDLNNATYAGRLHFSSSDTTATFSPQDAAVTSAQATPITVTLKKAGPQTVTVVDSLREGTPAALSRTVDVLVGVGPTARMDALGLVPQVAGVAFTLDLRARDAQGNVADALDGVFTFTTCGLVAAAGGPATATFVDGVGTTVSMQTTIAAPAPGCALALEGVTGLTMPNVQVNAADLHHFYLSAGGAPVVPDQVARVVFPLRIEAKDAFNNTRVLDTGAVTVTAAPSALNAALTANLAAGVATPNIDVRRATTTTPTSPATEVVTVTRGSVSTPTNAFRVNPAGADHYRVTLASAEAKTAGVAFALQVAIEDLDDNVRWQTTPAPTLPTLSAPAAAACTFTPGALVDGIVPYSVLCTGTQMAAQVAAAGLAAPREGAFTFDLHPAVAASLSFTHDVGSPGAGTPFPVTIHARDAFGNRNLTTAGDVTLASGCALASPATVALVAGQVTTNANLTKAASGCTLAASFVGLEGDTTNAFTVVPSVPYKLDVVLAATGVAGGQVVATMTQLDFWDNRVTSGPNATAVTRDLIFSGLAGWDGTPANASATADGVVTPFGGRIQVAFADGVGTAWLRLPRAAEQAVDVQDHPASPLAWVLRGRSTNTTIEPAAEASLGLLSANATTLVGRTGILSSESVNGRVSPFAATVGAEHTFHAGSFDAFDNLRGPGVGRWFDHGVVNGAPTSSGTTFLSAFTFMWLGAGADEVELLPRGQTTQAAIIPGSAALAVYVG